MKAFSLRSGTRCLLTPLLFNIVRQVLARSISQEKEKVTKLKMKKKTILANDTILYGKAWKIRILELITNSMMLQITSGHKKQLCFYTPTMKKNPKRKLRKQYVYNSIQSCKIPKNKFHRGVERLIHWKLQNFAETN